MAVFEIEVGGKIFEVEAPDQAAALAAIKGLKLQGEAPPAGLGEMSGFAPSDGDLGMIEPNRGSPGSSKTMGEALGEIGRKADNLVRIGANGVTFGLADRFAGWAGGEGKEAERAKTRQAKKEEGAWGTAAEIAGSIIPAAGLARAGLTAANLIPGAVKGVGRVGALIGAGAADGAALGALNALGHDENVTRGTAAGAIGGAAGSAIGQTISGVAGGIARYRRPTPEVPTREAMQSAERAAWGKFDDSGALYKPEALRDALQTIKDEFARKGADPGLQPRAFVALKRLEEEVAKEMPITAKGMQTLNRVAGGAYEAGNKDSNSLAKFIRDELRRVISNPNSALAGDAAAAAKAMAEGNKLNSQLRKLDRAEDFLGRAEMNAATAGKGTNIDNATRTQLKSLWREAERSKSLTADEKAALKDAIFGSSASNMFRSLGAAAPTGVVSTGISGAAGYGLLGPVGAVALPAAGFAAKAVADKLRENAAERYLSVIRSGGSAERAFGVPTAAEKFIERNSPGLLELLRAAGISAAPALAPSGN